MVYGVVLAAPRIGKDNGRATVIDSVECRAAGRTQDCEARVRWENDVRVIDVPDHVRRGDRVPVVIDNGTGQIVGGGTTVLAVIGLAVCQVIGLGCVAVGLLRGRRSH